jgi:Spy/CpxP family protein refolding chaperone
MSDTSATRKAALWVGAVFLLGAALGGVLGYVCARRSHAATTASQSEEARRAHRVAQLTRELSLTSAQGQQIDAILLRRHAEAKVIRDQSEAQVDQVHQKARDEIRAILTPEQKPKFEDFLKRLDEGRKRNAPH